MAFQVKIDTDKQVCPCQSTTPIIKMKIPYAIKLKIIYALIGR